uniref:Uncharacterized protein n=1 Tax=Peronospora matthiolae TaxID=2874970 RepID=A0AAV1U8F7_9STRA
MIRAALVKCDSGWFHAEAVANCVCVCVVDRELYTLKIEGSIPSSDI